MFDTVCGCIVSSALWILLSIAILWATAIHIVLAFFRAKGCYSYGISIFRARQLFVFYKLKFSAEWICFFLHAKFCFWSYKSLKWPGHQASFLSFLETKVEKKWCTNGKMHHRGWALGPRVQNVDTCAPKQPAWMVKPLSADCVEYWLCRSGNSENIDPQADQR